MKSKLHLIAATCLSILMMMSCTDDVDNLSIKQSVKEEYMNRDTHVSIQDVKKIAGIRQTNTGTARKVKGYSTKEEDFIFIIDDDNDTLFYVVNHPDGGWTMYASDKRVPAIVAMNNEGCFNLSEMEEVAKEWFGAMKEDMKMVKMARDEDLSFSEDEIASNISYWDAVCDVDKFIAAHSDSDEVRGHGPINPGIPVGHYELYSTEYQTLVYDSIAHLTTTLWHQESPYNTYCPLKSNSSYERAPAGCVAISGAQMLYYLHYKIGVPDSIPDCASCTGNVNNYQMYQWYSGIDTWALFTDNGNGGDAIYAAPLIANVGKLVRMEYYDLASFSEDIYLKDSVFIPYGIDCQYISIDYDILCDNLLDSIPVIAEAYHTKYGENDYYGGHSFIIDGSQRTRTKVKYTYKWVLDAPWTGPGLPIMPNDRIVIYYTDPTVKYVRMNWGYGNITANNTWYALSGDWIVYSSNYIYKREMLYGYAPL